MKPVELLEALKPLVGRLVSADTADGATLFVAQAVRHLAPRERRTRSYDVLIQREPPAQGIVIPSARVNGVRQERGAYVLELAHGREVRIFVLSDELMTTEDRAAAAQL